VLTGRIRAFLTETLSQLMQMSEGELIAQRYAKFRSMGLYDNLSLPEREGRIQKAIDATAGGKKKKAGEGKAGGAGASKIIRFIAETTMSGEYSRHRKLGGASCPEHPPPVPPKAERPKTENAKSVLDSRGPEALALWVREHSKVSEIRRGTA
jgi:hypothetical protein